jgi:drug/metabolite transporter (DMT)-like permease
MRVYAVLVFFIALKAAGNLSLALGMKHLAHPATTNPLDYVLAMLSPFVALGVALLIVSLLARMALLSYADLTFILPLTAVGYVIAAFLGRFFLHEHVSAARWAGTLLIFGGAALVSATPHATTLAAGSGEEA